MPLTQRMDLAVPPAGSDEPTEEDTVTQVLQEAEAAPAAHQPPASSVRRGRGARRCPACQQAFSGEARFCPFDGDALIEAPDWNPSADPLIGSVVEGRYEVISVIGEGGMGTVYEVKHITLGRRFALKVLRRDIADAEHTARFIQEAKAAAAIGHVNIVAVSDFGELAMSGKPSQPAVPFFVMEFLNGISLAALLRAEKTIEPARAARILLQCASGLAAAHAAGVIHRDLKPDNVFLVHNGDREFVKLLDFGVAKMAGAGRLTRAGMVFGTPHYMSPEQAAGESVDHRADIYALGVLLYECFSGRVPFEADTYMGVLTKHMFATPEPIERVVADAAALGPLAPIVMKCLEKAPHDRYASMAELGAALELALGEVGTASSGAGTSSPEPRVSPAPRSRPASVSDLPLAPVRPLFSPLVVGLGVVALCAGAFAGVRWLRAAPPPAETTPVMGATASASTSTIAVAPPLPSEAPPAMATAASEPSAASPPPVARPPRGAAPPKPLPAPSVTKPAKPHKPGGDVVDPWG